MSFTPDNNVIVNRNTKGFGSFDYEFRHIDICKRCGGVARRMVVNKNDRCRRQFQRTLDHFSYVDGYAINGTFTLHFVGDEPVLLIEKENSNELPLFVSLCGADVLENLPP